jgi:putative transposase
MEQKRTYSYRLECSKEQKELMSQYAGCARYIYNYGLGLIKEALEQDKKPPSCIDTANLLPRLKRVAQTAWLKKPHSQVLQQSLIDLNRAIQAFFNGTKGKVGFPHFRKKGVRDSFRFPQNVEVEGDRVFLPKIGWLKMRYSRPIEGAIKQATVKKVGQHWYVHIVCTVEKEVHKVALDEKRAIGIDLGLLVFATVSNGLVIPNPKYLAKELKKLRYYQKAYSRTKKGSKNREKIRIKLAKQHERVKNRRNDFLQKLTTMLVKNHDLIALENLSIQGMMKNRRLARAIADVGWYRFRSYLQYKCQWYGKHLVIIDKFEPTSKTCSSCKAKQDMPLSERLYVCHSCGMKMDRDLNASLNIRAAGISAFLACREGL